MTASPSKLSPAFEAFMSQAPSHAQAWMKLVQELDHASRLEPKTKHLSYVAVLAALRMESGLPLHVQLAKKAGASREEVLSAILVGLPAAGHTVVQVLPAALSAYDSE